MEISGASSATTAAAAAASNNASEYSVKVLKKALDAEATQGAALAQMVAQTAGVGRTLDTYA